jgi:hypothetical protein
VSQTATVAKNLKAAPASGTTKPARLLVPLAVSSALAFKSGAAGVPASGGDDGSLAFAIKYFTTPAFMYCDAAGIESRLRKAAAAAINAAVDPFLTSSSLRAGAVLDALFRDKIEGSHAPGTSPWDELLRRTPSRSRTSLHAALLTLVDTDSDYAKVINEYVTFLLLIGCVCARGRMRLRFDIAVRWTTRPPADARYRTRLSHTRRAVRTVRTQHREPMYSMLLGNKCNAADACWFTYDAGAASLARVPYGTAGARRLQEWLDDLPAVAPQRCQLVMAVLELLHDECVWRWWGPHVLCAVWSAARRCVVVAATPLAARSTPHVAAALLHFCVRFCLEPTPHPPLPPRAPRTPHERGSTSQRRASTPWTDVERPLPLDTMLVRHVLSRHKVRTTFPDVAGKVYTCHHYGTNVEPALAEMRETLSFMFAVNAVVGREYVSPSPA